MRDANCRAAAYQSVDGGLVEPAELRLLVVTWLQRKAFGRVVGGDARVPLADVSHPGVVKVLILRKNTRATCYFARCKKLHIGPVSKFILYLWWLRVRLGD